MGVPVSIVIKSYYFFATTKGIKKENWLYLKCSIHKEYCAESFFQF